MNLSEKLSIKTGLDITIADMTDKMFGSRVVIQGYYPGDKTYTPVLFKRFDTLGQVEIWVHEYPVNNKAA